MSKFSFPRSEKEQVPDIHVDPGKLEAFASGAGDHERGRPWAKYDPKAQARHNVSVRLNDYHLAMLQYVAKDLDISQQKILRKHLIPVIEGLAEETYAKATSS